MNGMSVLLVSASHCQTGDSPLPTADTAIPNPTMTKKKRASDRILCRRLRGLLPKESETMLEVDLSNKQVVFHNCFKRRRRRFLSWRNEERYVCSFNDVLFADKASYDNAYRSWFLLIITTKGQARVTNNCSNITQALDVLKAVAENTPSAPFWERNINLTLLMVLSGSLLLAGVIVLLAYWLTG